MHPHRSSALGYASAASAAHSRVYGACAAEAAASESSGLSVGGCIRAWRYFRPYPVVFEFDFYFFLSVRTWLLFSKLFDFRPHPECPLRGGKDGTASVR